MCVCAFFLLSLEVRYTLASLILNVLMMGEFFNMKLVCVWFLPFRFGSEEYTYV